MTPAGWVAIAERMPPEGDPVWLWGPGGETPPMTLGCFKAGLPDGPRYMRDTWSHFNAEQTYVKFPAGAMFTHWHPVEQPLPPA